MSIPEKAASIHQTVQVTVQAVLLYRNHLPRLISEFSGKISSAMFLQMASLVHNSISR
jgi:hypothetical protein